MFARAGVRLGGRFGSLGVFAGVRWVSRCVRLGSFWVRTFNSAKQQRGARNLNVEKFDVQSSEPKDHQVRH